MSRVSLPSGKKDSILSIQWLRHGAAKRRIDLAGEGGEYDTLTLNAPFCSRPITYTTSEIRATHDRHERVPGGFS
jgi:diphthine-ammonia ligase